MFAARCLYDGVSSDQSGVCLLYSPCAGCMLVYPVSAGCVIVFLQRTGCEMVCLVIAEVCGFCVRRAPVV